jgi:nucleotide-binding universal stress UspA family protein
MTVVAGFAPDGRGRAVLHLAAMLARSGGEDLVVCAVVPAPWPPSPARVDAEYQGELTATAEQALDRARARLPDDVAATFVVHHARSVPAGLLEAAEDHRADLVVAGSSTRGGAGHVELGSVTSRLLHSSPLPVALAPRGFRAGPGARVTRVTAAFAGSGNELVVAAAGVSARTGAGLRVASFAVQPHAPYTSGVGREGDDAILDEWRHEIRAAARHALDDVAALPVGPRDLDAVVGQGETWDEALEDVDWREGDVLVVGSSSAGPVARVFLGSRSNKIVRHSPVPVVVVPRPAAADLAEEAMEAPEERPRELR